MHASRSRSKETAHPTTVPSHFHPENDRKMPLSLVFCYPRNDASPGVSGMNQSPLHRIVISRTITCQTVNRITALVYAATIGDLICIRHAAKTDSKKTSFIADTGSMVSLINSNQRSTTPITPRRQQQTS